MTCLEAVLDRVAILATAKSGVALRFPPQSKGGHSGSFFGLRWQPKGDTALGNELNTYDAERGCLSKQTCF